MLHVTRDLVQVRGGPGLRHDADARQDDRRHDGTVRQEGHQRRDVILTRIILGSYSIHTLMYYINIFHIYLNKHRYFLDPGEDPCLRIFAASFYIHYDIKIAMLHTILYSLTSPDCR